MANRISRFACLALLLALGGCATGGAFVRAAERAEQAQDYDLAVAEYTKALKADPDNRSVRLALERARLRASQDHFNRGRRLEATGRLDEALIELQLAAE